MIVIRRGVSTAFFIALSFLIAAPNTALAKDKKKAHRAFIEQTRIYAPKRVGEFMLESTDYDPRAKYAGASLRYEHVDYPGVRFDLFVYPAGDMPHARALEAGMKDFMSSFDAGVQMKYYSDLEIVSRQGFEIPLDRAEQATAAPSENSKPAIAVSEEEARKEAAIVAALTPKPIVGERVDLRYRMSVPDTSETIAMRSRGYLFYKQLYYFKGRISAAESGIDQNAFETASDLAIRELVPTVRAANIGSCAQTTIAINPNALDQGDDALMLQILGSFIDTTNRSCFATAADAEEIVLKGKDDQYTVVTIEYDPGDWGEQ